MRRRDRLRIAALHTLRVLVRGADATAGALCSEAHTHMLIHACHSRRTAVATAALSALVNVLKVSHQRALGALGGGGGIGARPVDGDAAADAYVRAGGLPLLLDVLGRRATVGHYVTALRLAHHLVVARADARRWLLSAGISAAPVSLSMCARGRRWT